MLAKDSKKAQKIKEKLLKQYNLQVCIILHIYIYTYIYYIHVIVDNSIGSISTIMLFMCSSTQSLMIKNGTIL